MQVPALLACSHQASSGLGLGLAWHFQQIEVLNKKTGDKYLFRCDGQ